eukprot:3507525-Pyramimonas_sp.AAC.1
MFRCSPLSILPTRAPSASASASSLGWGGGSGVPGVLRKGPRAAHDLDDAEGSAQPARPQPNAARCHSDLQPAVARLAGRAPHGHCRVDR